MARSLLCLAIPLAACDLVPIDPTDSTPPVAEVLVNLTGAYVPMTEVDLTFGATVPMMCRVTDGDGVKWARFSFSGAASSTCTVSSQVGSGGSFPVSPPLPAPLEQTLSGMEVPTVLPLLYDLPDVSCQFAGEQGRPYGHEIVATCEGANWNLNNEQTDSASLTIRVQ